MNKKDVMKKMILIDKCLEKVKHIEATEWDWKKEDVLVKFHGLDGYYEDRFERLSIDDFIDILIDEQNRMEKVSAHNNRCDEEMNYGGEE